MHNEHVEQNLAGPLAGQIHNPPVLQSPDGGQDVHGDAETSNVVHQSVPTVDRTGATTDNPSVLPSAQGQWDTIGAMVDQMAGLTKMLTLVPRVHVDEKQGVKEVELWRSSLNPTL